MAENPNAFMSESNNADNVKVIKQYALFLFPEGTLTGANVPSNKEWKPPTNEKPIGYSTEDGAVLHPENGEETEIKGHNGDVVISDTSGGYWTLQLAGIECKKQIAQAYFGVTVDSDGSIHADNASNTANWTLVLAALDQKGRPIVLYAPSVTIGEREDMNLKYTEQISMGITFKMRKKKGEHMFSLFGFIEEETPSAPKTNLSPGKE